MHEFWYDCVKPKYGEDANLCYMDTGSFIFHVRTDDIYQGFSGDYQTRFDTFCFELKSHYQKKEHKGYWLNEGRIRWTKND